MIRFEYPEQVYDFIRNPRDAWTLPMVEHFIEEAGLDDGDDFDVTELNEWLETELEVLEEGFNDWLDTE